MGNYKHEYDHEAALQEDELRGYLDKGWAPVPNEQFEIDRYVHPLGLEVYHEECVGWRLIVNVPNSWPACAIRREISGSIYVYVYLSARDALFDAELLVRDPYARFRFADDISAHVEETLTRRKEELKWEQTNAAQLT